MKLALNDVAALFVNFNARAEIHGDETEPAGDISLKVDLPNERLAEFHPDLKGVLYHKDPSRETSDDLADKANDAPHLRFQRLRQPLRFSEEMAGVVLTINKGAGKPLKIKDAKANDFQVTCREGGTIELRFRVQCHPDEAQSGKLCAMIKHEVRVTLEPGEDVPEGNVQPS